MELTRRDALAALAAAGVTVGGGAILLSGGKSSVDRETALEEGHRETLVAAAEVLYPSEVEGVDAFVRRYVAGLVRERPEHVEGIAGALAYLDAYADSWFDAPFAALDPGQRDEALRKMGVDGIDPVPDGSERERVRYYVVNELLFALYSSPTGGRLVGIENPPGHPGGLASYQRGHQP